MLAGIGLVSGFFAALFGVGGGIVVVPLLILLGSFDGKLATGTSLAAIGVTAVYGAIGYAILGEVDWERAAQVGLPAIAGAFVGVRLQQRLSSRLLVLLFSAFLVCVAVLLLLR
jgi:uncharacterized membrane protein YfcA